MSEDEIAKAEQKALLARLDISEALRQNSKGTYKKPLIDFAEFTAKRGIRADSP